MSERVSVWVERVRAITAVWLRFRGGFAPYSAHVSVSFPLKELSVGLIGSR